MLPTNMEARVGGMGSGARRTTRMGDIDDTLTLDARALRRLGVLRAGECVCDTVRWSSGAVSAPSARLRVDLSDIERGGTMTIAANVTDFVTQRIAIDAVPSAFGGWRCYFLCPVTARRCEVLYYAEGRFASREAQRLTYATQNMTDLSRLRRKAAKLRSRLCGSGRQPRPRGQNRIDLVERVHETERKTKALYHDRLSAMVERSGAPRMPKAR